MTDAVFIRIVADTSGMGVALDGIKRDLGELKSVVQGMAAGFEQGFDGMRDAAARGAQAIDQFSASLHAARPEEFAAAVNKATQAASAHAKATKDTATETHSAATAIAGFGTALGAAFAIGEQLFDAGKKVADIAVEMGKAAEKTSQLGQRLGLSTHQVQTLQAMSKATGADFDKLAQSTSTLSKNFAKSPEGFRRLGIDIKAGSDQMAILAAVADKFAKTADGPQKTAMAFQLMGRSGAEMVPFLNQGAQGLADLTKKAEEYGAVNDDAVQKGLALAGSVNEAKLAWSGLGQTLTVAFGPVLKEAVDDFNSLIKAITQSYQSGGAAKIIFDGLAEAFSALLQMAGDLLSGLEGLFSVTGGDSVDWGKEIKDTIDEAVSDFKDLIEQIVWFVAKCEEQYYLSAYHTETWWADVRQTYDNFMLGVDELVAKVKLLGMVVQQALNFQWGDIASTWDKGMAQIQDVVTRRGAMIAAAAAKAKADAAQNVLAAIQVDLAYAKWDVDFRKPKAPASGGIKGTGNGEGDGSGNASRAAPRSRAAKSDKPDVVGQYRTELQDQLLEEKNWGVDTAQFELHFWQDKLAATKAGTDQWKAINREVQRAQLAVAKETQQEEIADIKSALAIKTDLAKTETTIARAKLQDKLEAIDEDARAERIGAVQAVTLRNNVNRELRQLDEQAENDDYQAKLDALNAEFNIDHLGVTEKANIHRQIEQLRAEHENRMRTISAQNASAMLKDANAKADAIRAKWQSIFQPITQAWTQSLQGMVNGTTNLRKALLSIGNAIETEAFEWMGKVLTRFLVNEATKTAATEAGAAARSGIEEAASVKSIALSAITALKQIVHQAAVAAAGAYSAIARIPYVGPVLAPAAAAAALYGVYSLGKSVLSAEGGLGEVPEDGTLISAHAREMVLPASLAIPLRQMLLSGGAANNNAPPAANDGGTAFHYHDHAGTRTPDDITANLDAFARAIKKAHRAGKLGFALPSN
ncbi:hypothetical protein [Sphingomonas sp.]|uniref:hypothetical protein n=1 Tax=Sphingomonas sp. TaxID=28214 RepID=UPI0025CF68AA|nr:hypothetical protein [Sphingomonas sp.]